MKAENESNQDVIYVVEDSTPPPTGGKKHFSITASLRRKGGTLVVEGVPCARLKHRFEYNPNGTAEIHLAVHKNVRFTKDHNAEEDPELPT